MKRLALLALSLLLLLLPACRGGYVPSSPAPPPRASAPPEPTPEPTPAPTPALTQEEYLALASALHRHIVEEAELLARLGLYEYNWRASRLGGPGVEGDLTGLYPLAASWLSDNFQRDPGQLEAGWAWAVSAYARLTQSPLAAPVPDGLAPQLDGLMAAYHQLYQTVTCPGGTVPEFADMLCSCVWSIDRAHQELTALLEVSLL